MNRSHSVDDNPPARPKAGLFSRLLDWRPKPPVSFTEAEAPPKPSEISMASDGSAGSRRLAKAKSVLIVSANESKPRQWKREIEEWGYAVEHVTHSEMGLDKLFDVGYDALLIDAAGPEIAGLAAVEEIRSERAFKNLFIGVFVSDKGQGTGEENAAISAGANRVFRRADVTSEQILTALKTALFPRVYQVQPRMRRQVGANQAAPALRPSRVIAAPAMETPSPTPVLEDAGAIQGPAAVGPKKILIIEDDQTLAGIYRTQIEAAGYEVEVALDGATGFHDLHTIAPSALIVDLFLPGLSGLDIIKKTHIQKKFEKLPIFVFTSGYSREVEAQAREAGASRFFDKSSCVPADVVAALNELFFSATAGAAGDSARGSADRVSRPGASIPMNAPIRMGAGGDDALKTEIREALLQDAPEIVKALRKHLSDFLRATKAGAESRNEQLVELHRRVHSLIGNAAIAGFTRVARLSSAVDAMLREFQERPDAINVSSQRTLTQAIDFLALLFTRSARAETEAAGSEKILVVDDEVISRRVIRHSLEKANLRPDVVDHPQAALDMLGSQEFDLIFLDVEMPDMSGFELCKELRALPRHAKTPVIFVTALNGFDSRAKSSLSGGDDFIGKPFSYIELAVKALIYVLRTGAPASALPAGNAGPSAKFSAVDSLRPSPVAA